MGRYLDDTFRRKIVFFTGKGGVGKSTLCYATALACLKAKKKPLVALWEPFDSEPGQHPLESMGIERLRLDALSCFKEYALQTVKFEKLYDTVFDNQLLRTFVRTTPGVGDGVIAGKIWNLAQNDDYDIILVDLPSTGHTFSFFKSPKGIRKIFTIGAIHRQAMQICDFFESDKTRVDFVSLPEELPLTECGILIQDLKTILKVPYGFLFLNQLTPHFSLPDPERMPPELRPLHALYRSRWQNDDSAKDSVKRWDLPQISIPFEDHPHFLGMIESLSERLREA